VSRDSSFRSSVPIPRTYYRHRMLGLCLCAVRLCRVPPRGHAPIISSDVSLAESNRFLRCVRHVTTEVFVVPASDNISTTPLHHAVTLRGRLPVSRSRPRRGSVYRRNPNRPPSVDCRFKSMIPARPYQL